LIETARVGENVRSVVVVMVHQSHNDSEILFGSDQTVSCASVWEVAQKYSLRVAGLLATNCPRRGT